MNGAPTQQSNESNKTLLSIKKNDLVGENKPNFLLIFKVSNEVDNTKGTRIRQSMFKYITDDGWKSYNSQTSQFYFRRYDGTEGELVAATKGLLSKAIVETKTLNDLNFSWGINFIITKLLSADWPDGELNINALFEEQKNND